MFSEHINTHCGGRIFHFDSIASTNSFLINHAAPAICTANHQTAGRGRHGKIWQSTAGHGIALSISWPVDTLEHSTGLSLVIGIAVLRVLQQYGIAAKVKWPNDLLIYNGNGQLQKVAGILIEVHQDAGGHKLIIGCGVNVFSAPDGATFLQHHTNIQLDIALLIRQCVDEICVACQQFFQYGLLTFRPQWLQHAAFIHKPVTLQQTDIIHSGLFIDIDTIGALVLEQHGIHHAFSSGTLRLATP